MRLKVFEKEISNKKHVLIGKNGSIRFNEYTASIMKLEKKMYWLLAIDEDEKQVNTLYLIRSDKKYNTWETQLLNGKWVLNGSEFIAKLNINTPIKCELEEFNSKTFSGFKLKFLK